MIITGDAKIVASAFVKARGEMNATVTKDKKGNFGDYATLAALVEASAAPLAKHGLAIIQEASIDEGGVTVATWLVHESGSVIEFAPLTMLLTDRKPQAVGSAITYARRYQLASVCGLAPDDDDGQAAQDGETNAKSAKASQKSQVASQVQHRHNEAAKAQNAPRRASVAVDVDFGMGTPDAQHAIKMTQQAQDASEGDSGQDNPFNDNMTYYVREWNKLTGKEYDLVKWVATLHDKSDGPCTAKQYQYLVGLINALTNDQHGFMLSFLCQSEITKSNMPGKKVAANLIEILPETIKIMDVEQPNEKHRADIAEMIAAMSQPWDAPSPLTDQAEDMRMAGA